LRILQARSACRRRAAPAASAEGASIAGRAPQARGCSITRRGEQQTTKKKDRRRAAPAARADGARMGGRAPQARGFSLTRRGEQKKKKKKKKKKGAQRLLQARSACCERRRRKHCGPSAAGARIFDHAQG
jgi:hypothetical protein